MRELAGGPRRRILEDLHHAYLEELRLARQLRLHAERVPYLPQARTLEDLAAQEDVHGASLEGEIRRLGGLPDLAGLGEPRGGRNHWERLSLDLAAIQAHGKRFIELAQRWDIDHPETATLLMRLAHEEGALARVVGELLARSDPHAVD